METWKRRRYLMQPNGKRKLVLVGCIGYTAEEAKQRGITPCLLKDLIHDPNRWFITDDGIVVRAHKLWTTTKRNGNTVYNIDTDIGMANITMKAGTFLKLPSTSFAVFKAQDYKPLFTKNDYRKGLRGRRARIFAKLYVHFVMKGLPVDWEMLGGVLQATEKSKTVLAKKVIKYWEMERMIDQETMKILEKSGVTFQSAIDKMEEAYNVAKAKNDANSMIRVAENYLDIFKKDLKSNNDQNQLPESNIGALEEHVTNAELILQGKQPPTSIEKVQEAIYTIEEANQDEILAQANELLEKPVFPTIPERK